MLNPVRSDASQVRVHHRTRVHLESGCRLKNGSQSRSFSGWAPVDGHDFFLPGLDLEFFCHLSSVVRRSPIRNEDHTSPILVMHGQAVSDHLDHMGNRLLVVVAGNSDEDVGRFNLLDPLACITSDSRIVMHRFTPSGVFLLSNSLRAWQECRAPPDSILSVREHRIDALFRVEDNTELAFQGLSQDDRDVHKLEKGKVIWAIPESNGHQFTIPFPESLHEDGNRFPFSGMSYQMPEPAPFHNVQASSSCGTPDLASRDLDSS